MKLNPDCIRDILLTVEENTSFSSPMFYQRSDIGYTILLDDTENDIEPINNYEKLNSYQNNEVLYHINQCDLAGFFTSADLVSGGYIIEDLSPNGHEFLANIRNDSNWDKVINGCKKIGTFSLPFIKEIALQVIKKNISDVF